MTSEPRTAPMAASDPRDSRRDWEAGVGLLVGWRLVALLVAAIVGVEIGLAKDGDDIREGVAREEEEETEEGVTEEEAWTAAGDDASVAFTERRWTTVMVTTEIESISSAWGGRVSRARYSPGLAMLSRFRWLSRPAGVRPSR